MSISITNYKLLPIRRDKQIISSSGVSSGSGASSGGGGISATWGSIGGTLTNQTDLTNALNLKANLASPTFTGTILLTYSTGGHIGLKRSDGEDAGTFGINADDAGLMIRMGGGGSYINFATNSTATAVRILDNGNVGIGTLSPAKLLEINTVHAANIDDEIRIGSYYNGYFHGLSLNYRIDGVGAPLKYLVEYSGGIRYNSISLNNGNVGIGTTSPDKLLTLADTGSMGSVSFTSGFTGNGWQQTMDGSDYNLEVDNLRVRKALTAYELDINKISSINGGMMISIANGTSTTYTSLGSNEWNIYFDLDGGRKGIEFQLGDFVRAQIFTGRGVAYFSGEVDDDSNKASGWIRVNSTYTPWDKMELVQVGNSTDATRQNLIYLTAANTNNPYIEGHSGVTTGVFTDTTRQFRLGNLTGITDATLSPSGYGLYAQNVFLSGKIVAFSGLIGAWNIDSDSIYSGTKVTGDGLAASPGDMTIKSNGSLHSKNFAVNVNGDVLITQPQPHWNNKVLSGNARNSHNAEASTTSSSYVKLKTITLINGLIGSVYVKFDMKSAEGHDVTGQVWCNGSPLGVEWVDASDSDIYVNHTDIFNAHTFNPGDTIELWAHTVGYGFSVYVQNFKICYDDGPPVVIAVASVNS